MPSVEIEFAKDEEIRKLAQLLSDETDAAAIELGFVELNETVPYVNLSDESKAVYQELAKRVYNRLAFHTGAGYIVVVGK